MVKLKYWDWWTTFIVAIFLLVFSILGLGIFYGIKAISHIEKHGLKSVIEQIWEGEEVK